MESGGVRAIILYIEYMRSTDSRKALELRTLAIYLDFLLVLLLTCFYFALVFVGSLLSIVGRRRLSRTNSELCLDAALWYCQHCWIRFLLWNQLSR